MTYWDDNSAFQVFTWGVKSGIIYKDRSGPDVIPKRPASKEVIR